MNMLDLRGRKAVVTGGASGIGLAIARRLTASGATVALWDLSESALVAARTSLGDSSTQHIVVDVSDAEAVTAATSETLQALGSIDILVNSAGITGPNALVEDYPVDAWQRVLAVNLTGIFLTCRALVPQMRTADYGRVVNVASVAGKEGNPNAAAYSASKAGVIALTKSLGKELASTGVTVNCVAPGAVKTALFDQMSQVHIDYMLSKIPMGRFGTTDEVAAMVAWLCTAECSFSTGATFDLSGGRATY
jgi:3-oxoacyl-[acyl-carrier protein] reductase